MSQYYTPNRKRNLYDPNSKSPYRLSRSKLELLLTCPRCFYNDRRLGIAQPPGFPFNLNSAVDTLLKREFDIYRARRQPHPLMVEAGVDAVPFAHDLLEEWRDALRGGIKYLHQETNLEISGGIDDLWITPERKLIIVDYKATSKKGEVSLDAEWQISYKRQMAIYSWLFKQNGFDVNPIGYFVYCNGDADREQFNSALNFKISIFPLQIRDDGVELAIKRAYACLNLKAQPPASDSCDFCAYHHALQVIEEKR